MSIRNLKLIRTLSLIWMALFLTPAIVTWGTVLMLCLASSAKMEVTENQFMIWILFVILGALGFVLYASIHDKLLAIKANS